MSPAPLRVSRQPDGEPEIFHSLQGEGVSIGTPSVFLRLALCNLVCTWCDTRYTWDWRAYDYRVEVMEAPLEIVEEKIVGYECPHLVVTGGEPLLQQKALAPLLHSLARRGFSIEVETNGTITPEPGLLETVEQWNVSPKLANSVNSPHRREVSESLHAFQHLPNAYFKLVVVEPSDLEEIVALVQTYDIPRNRVILMPEGRDPQHLRESSEWLSRICVKEGFRFSSRLHILLWGDKRGT